MKLTHVVREEWSQEIMTRVAPRRAVAASFFSLKIDRK
jgi:hypothetical protein